MKALVLSFLAAILFVPSLLLAAERPWTEVPPSQWQGNTKAKIAGLKGPCAATVAYPANQAAPLVCTTAGPCSAGWHEVRLVLRPAHVAGRIAFHSGVRVKAGKTVIAEMPGELFARAHQPEVRTCRFVQPRSGPLTLTVEAFADAGAVEKAFTAAELKNAAGMKSRPDAVLGKTQGSDAVDEILNDIAGKSLTPDTAVYYILDSLAVRPLSQSGRVVKVETDKVRYLPGETLRGAAVIEDVGGKGGEGALKVYLEHNVRDRVLVHCQPVRLGPKAQTVPLEVALPKEELGYALVAEFVSCDGADRSEAAEYFTIAENYLRVAVFTVQGGGGKEPEEQLRAMAQSLKEGYVNCVENFAWAEDDMVAMSPETDFWFSGQTWYHASKKGLKRKHELFHSKGISVVTYGKFIMGGYPGWVTAYDYPSDHRSQYYYPVGMWEGVNVRALDWVRNKEFQMYSGRPRTDFELFAQPWAPINPDPTPRMARIAAEEMARSAAMFGWDGVRWDGHPRGGGQCGGAGEFDLRAARRTQTLVRYFKDIMAAKYPNFRHGYNYFFIQKPPGYDWAYEDYELDELCRSGGLLMNESIGNATQGPFEYIAQNLQVEGDLCRERAGYFLGISSARGRRDELVEGALWAASGARTYGTPLRELRRYYTRYSQYTLDENLRRLVTPEKVLQPTSPTRLWWQPFVYETPLIAGKRQLVVNLLNLPLAETRPPENTPPKFTMSPGTAPVGFALSLPVGIQAKAVQLIDPWTLAVTEVPLRENRFEVPAVGIWLVAVIDLAMDAKAPSLASLYGPPKTFGVPRPGLKDQPCAPVVLDVAKGIREANKDFAPLSPPQQGDTAETKAQWDLLAPAERHAKLLQLRAKNPAQEMIKGWWKGGSLPEDLKLKDKKLAFGDLTPQRNGRLDIFHARGAMDYRLCLAETFAGLGRFAVHDAPLMGNFRTGGGHWLANGMPWQRFREFDLLLCTAIPHCAMGAENCYAMVEYVKAGGAVLCTGGEYAFGKGGFMHTVLERELLPVLCVETVDTRYADEPLAIEPGPDFPELAVRLDFSPKPCFWVWNQVLLKDSPAVKVFLKSGNRPVLAGWQLGKGRVACLLLDHRGKSEGSTTAFFDWADWPKLQRALMAWLAPAARQAAEPAPPAAAALAADVRALCDQLLADRLLDDASGTGASPATAGPDDGGAKETQLAGERLKQRLEDIRRLLAAPASPLVAAALAEQLATVGALPRETRWAMLDHVRRRVPADVVTVARRVERSRNAKIRQCAYQLAALANGPAFADWMRGEARPDDSDPGGRQRALALGLVWHRQPDLAAVGRKRVEAWNAKERATMLSYTGGKGFSMAAPEHPCLDSDELFERAAWLAYLSRQDPKTFGAQFAREWLMLAAYEEFCDRTVASLWDVRNPTAAQKAKIQVAGEVWQERKAGFRRLRDVAQNDVLALVRSHPEAAADGFCRAHFTAEYRTCLNVLGDFASNDVLTILKALAKAGANPDLARFAADRLRVEIPKSNVKTTNKF
jgi:hypothetical protein